MAGHDDKSGDEGFLSRWSRRKAEAKTADDTAALAPEVVPETEASDQTPAPREPDEPVEFDVSTLPDIDSLGPGSDFSMFMQAGVPPALKTKALRKLWRVKPELANLDGLLDYGEDLTGSFKVVDHLKTAYEVGRGFLRDQADLAPDDDKAPDEDEAIQDDQIVADSKSPEASSRTSDGRTGAADIAPATDEPPRKS